MKIKLKLSLMVIGIMAAVVAGIALLLLDQSSNSAKKLSLENLYRLGSEQAEFWMGREESYLKILRTLANCMADYEMMPMEGRRDNFDAMLHSTLSREPNLVAMYSIWKPNVIDDDSWNIGRLGSAPNGQYAMTFTRESGEIVGRASIDVDNTMVRLTGPLAKIDRVDHPTPRIINGVDSMSIIMQVPIINPRDEVVGAVGLLLNGAVCQVVVERMMAQYDELAAMAVYSGNGYIMGHSIPDRVRKNLTEVDTIYGARMQEAVNSIRDGKKFNASEYSAVLGTNLEFCLSPIEIGNSDNKWSVMVATTEKYIMKEVDRLTTITFIVAAIAIVAVAAILFLVISSIINPIVNVTDTLRDISEGEGDLTKQVIANSKDEIGDLSRYFNLTLEKIKKLVFAIKRESGTLSEIGTDLASHMSETAAAVNQITANIQSIKGRVLNQSASVSETHATMEQVVANINKLDGLVEKQTSHVSNASSAIEEMAANIQSVTGTLARNAANVNT